MIRANSLFVAIISAGLAAGTMQMVHAASSPATPAAQKMDDDHYPHMHEALRDLRAAKDALKDADPRFRGHRDKAMDATDSAIHECEQALAEG
jgi:hypothetical protein